MPNPFQIPSYYGKSGADTFLGDASGARVAPVLTQEQFYRAWHPVVKPVEIKPVDPSVIAATQQAYQGFEDLIHRGASIEELQAYQRDAESRGLGWAMPVSFYTNYNPEESRRHWESLHPTSPTTPTTPVQSPTTPTAPTTPATGNTTTSPNVGNQSSFGTFDPFGTALADYFSGSYNSSPNYDPFGNFTRTHL